MQTGIFEVLSMAKRVVKEFFTAVAEIEMEVARTVSDTSRETLAKERLILMASSMAA